MSQSSFHFSAFPLLLAFVIAGMAGNKSCKDPLEGSFQQVCKQQLTVTDATSIDGCGFLLVNQGGDELLVSNFDLRLLRLEEGTSLSGNWGRVENGMSICMREDAIVEIRCLAVTELPPSLSEDCSDLVDPFDAPWAEKIMLSLNPNKVEHWTNGNSEALIFRSDVGVLAFSCTGDFLCFEAHQQGSPCLNALAELEDRKVIYVLNYQYPVK